MDGRQARMLSPRARSPPRARVRHSASSSAWRERSTHETMRVVPPIAIMVAAASAAACGGSVRGADAADTRRSVNEELEVGSGVPLTRPAPYARRRDASGWSGTSSPPTARGGGPIDGIAQPLDELRRTPTAPKVPAPGPTRLSPSDIEHDDTTTPSPATPAARPGEMPLPPVVGPPPPSPHVTTPKR